MSEPSSDDRVSPLLDKLKTLKELRENAEAERESAEVRIAEIKSGTRVKDRHLWLLLWANGDRSVYDEYRSLRDEVKHRRQQIAYLPDAREAVVRDLEEVIADDLERHDLVYRGIVSEQRELRRKKEVCHDALALVLRTRGNLTRVAASLHDEPKGRAAVAAAKKRPDEISAQLRMVREKVGEVGRIAGSRDLEKGGLVKKLNLTFHGSEFGSAETKKQLDDAVRTLNEIARKVEASADKIRERLTGLENDRVHMVRAKRDPLLAKHGLTATD